MDCKDTKNFDITISCAKKYFFDLMAADNNNFHNFAAKKLKIKMYETG